MNYGYLKPKIKDEDYVLGSLRSAPYEILVEDGQWIEYLPSPEYQRRGGTETMSCTVFGTENVLEAIFKRKFGISTNWSDRYVAVMANVGKNGADPQMIAEIIRTESGLIDEIYLPFVDGMSYDLFFSPKPMVKEYKDRGNEWLKEWQLKHEYCFTSGTIKEKQEKLKESLKMSPLGVSVAAWYQNEKGYFYKPIGEQDNHWTMMFGYKEGEYWLIFDSYDSCIKKLDWNYNFGIAKRYYIEKRPTTEELNIFQQIINLLAKVIGLQAVYVAKIIEEKKTIDMPIEEVKVEKYKWNTPADACHSFRTICDEVGLSVNEKNMLAKVLNCESGFNIKAINKNNDARKSTDYGICQYNDFWYADLITPEEALNDPEMAVRLYIDEYKAGRLKNWVCYKSGKYKLYNAKVA